MPSISKTKNNTYIVQYYEFGRKRNKTFKTKAEAKRFVALLELGKTESSSSLKFSDIIIDYKNNISNKKRGSRWEIVRLNALLKQPLANIRLSDLNPRMFQSYIESRTKAKTQTGGFVSGATIRREFTLIRSVLARAVKNGYIKENPARDLELPPDSEHRERVASDEDLEKLKIASGWDGVSVPENSMQLTILAFFFACRTGMRSGEILKLERSWISGNVIHLPKEATKTRASRNVSLGPAARKYLDLADQYVRAIAEQKKLAKLPVRFFPLEDSARDALFRKVRDRAGLGAVRDSQGRIIKEGLNFHDSRATFATWAASPKKTGGHKLELLDLARQTGHKNLKMLQRYYRATGEEIAQRIALAEEDEEE